MAVITSHLNPSGKKGNKSDIQSTTTGERSADGGTNSYVAIPPNVLLMQYILYWSNDIMQNVYSSCISM